MDVKKIGRIPDGGGWRAHGRQAGSTRRDRATRIGFDYVHSLVDEHSRLTYSEVLPDEKGPTCAGFLTRAADYFASRGITGIERVMTDNAWSYEWSLRTVVAALGARQVFIKSHCPWQNGKVHEEHGDPHRHQHTLVVAGHRGVPGREGCSPFRVVLLHVLGWLVRSVGVGRQEEAHARPVADAPLPCSGMDGGRPRALREEVFARSALTPAPLLDLARIPAEGRGCARAAVVPGRCTRVPRPR